MLYIVPTPIGNLGDITHRAQEVLSTVDLILAEDTRVTQRLLAKYEIHTPLRPYHAHNEHQTTANVIQLLTEGKTIALVSDAGTPGISDPGFMLVRACREAEQEVVVLPGPTAFVPALVGSGFPCDRFFFEGFLPHKKGRQTRWKYLATIPHTLVLYESPYRLIKPLLAKYGKSAWSGKSQRSTNNTTLVQPVTYVPGLKNILKKSRERWL